MHPITYPTLYQLQQPCPVLVTMAALHKAGKNSATQDAAFLRGCGSLTRGCGRGRGWHGVLLRVRLGRSRAGHRGGGAALGVLGLLLAAQVSQIPQSPQSPQEPLGSALAHARHELVKLFRLLPGEAKGRLVAVKNMDGLHLAVVQHGRRGISRRRKGSAGKEGESKGNKARLHFGGFCVW